MSTVIAKSDQGISRGDARILLYVYGVILLCSTYFVYINYRASGLIESIGGGVSRKSYFVSHLILVAVNTILWIVLARAAVRLKTYARSVITSPDGRALNYIANALLLGVGYAVLISMATVTKTLFLHTAYVKFSTDVTNLLPLAIIVLLSILLLIGSLKLNKVLPDGKRYPSRQTVALALAAYLLVMPLYAEYFYRVAPHLVDDDGLHHFALSPRVLLLVYALPYMTVWLLGLLACLNLGHYAKGVQGKIYRPLFRNLYKGLLLTFIGTYLVQVYTVSNFTSNAFGLGLVVLIALLLMIVRGCYLVYRGTNELYRIER